MKTVIIISQYNLDSCADSILSQKQRLGTLQQRTAADTELPTLEKQQ